MPTLSVQKRWQLKNINPQLQVLLSNALNIHPIVSQILVNRSVLTVEEAQLFLSGRLNHLHDPFLLKDMDLAVERIKKARASNQTVLVFGDYDVDGITSSVVLSNALKRVGIKVINHIPHRNEGYGLNKEIGVYAKQKGVELLITIDCGIGAFEEVEVLNQLGIDVIIIDHHMPSEDKLPNAVAVVNPKRKDCPYPFKHLASVGLAFKIKQALLGGIDNEDLDLVALGTIADVVPLRDENRIFVKEGLPLIDETKNKGLLALLDITKIKGKKMKPHYVGFILGPRINATGRMDTAQKSLELLMCEDMLEAYKLAKDLEGHNLERQRVQNNIIEEAMNMVEQGVNFNEDKVIVVCKEGWHKGVLGIVASRLAEAYYRPSIVISLENGMGVASCRSIEGFHLHEGLTYCSEALERFGGHKGAAGLTIKEENVENFRVRINEFARNNLQVDTLIPTLDIDCELPLSSISMDLARTIDSLEPFGEGNSTPLFCTRQLTVKSKPALLGKDTLKFWVSDGETSFNAVGFAMGKYADLVSLGKKIDIAYQLSIDDWNKEPMVQLKLKDIRES